ncbi:Uncharacterised protein [Mycobacteroides abscessus subsp. abscessus]|nr:Uncharacterised protein [Mycobacteroides abscessus subsp. abscessus]
MSERTSARDVMANRLVSTRGVDAVRTADDLLDALKANGYAVVALPRSLPITPEVQSGCEHTCLWFGQDSRIGAVTGWSDGVVNIDGTDLTVQEANSIGADLLAAAAAAERDSEER